MPLLFVPRFATIDCPTGTVVESSTRCITTLDDIVVKLTVRILFLTSGSCVKTILSPLRSSVPSNVAPVWPWISLKASVVDVSITLTSLPVVPWL